MTIIDDYIITQYPNLNHIVITLPQRMDTMTNTYGAISDRRRMLSEQEEAALLVAVKGMFENKTRWYEVTKK